MKPSRWMAAILLPLLLVEAHGGGQVMAEFRDANSRTAEVLAHVPLKAVIAEFLDPLDTGLGKSLGYLIWRETLTAISDQAGAGVIIAEAPPGERLVDMLAREYHVAAERIAQHQRGRMVLWGVVEPEGDTVLIEPYLSIRSDADEGTLRLTLTGKSRSGRSAWDADVADTSLSATISRSRFNFAPTALRRDALFRRPVITTAAVDVRRNPGRDAAVIRRVPAGRVLQAIDMQDAWFEVLLDEEERGYVHAGTFGRLQLPPPDVVADRRQVNLRQGPGTDHDVVVTRDLVGRFPVLDMRYRTGQGLWYRIDTGPRETWIAAWLVRPRFSVPAVHFLAGLYRYYGDRAGDGVGAFKDFIAAAGPQEDNVVQASAHQLLGACRLLNKGPARASLDDFSRAVDLTPYDPEAYLLRSVAAFGGGLAGAALDDLEQALALDAGYPAARQLTATAATLARGDPVGPLAILTGLIGESRRTEHLARHYGIEPE